MCVPWEVIHSEECEGFTIDFAAMQDGSLPELDWEVFDKDQIIDEIERGVLLHFTARVTASTNGIVLGSDYLWGCLYYSINEFINEENGYYQDMRDEVIRQAKRQIKA